eukprot:3363594-Amphidinium_carterae.1
MNCINVLVFIDISSSRYTSFITPCLGDHSNKFSNGCCNNISTTSATIVAQDARRKSRHDKQDKVVVLLLLQHLACNTSTQIELCVESLY